MVATFTFKPTPVEPSSLPTSFQSSLLSSQRPIMSAQPKRRSMFLVGDEDEEDDDNVI
jgi:hypothetical protein